MAKISRTYRLSEEVIQMIESRNNVEYRTANEFVEKAVMAFASDKFSGRENTDVLRELDYLKKELLEIKRILKLDQAVMDSKPEGKPEYSLPRI